MLPRWNVKGKNKAGHYWWWNAKLSPHRTLFWMKTTLRAGQKWCDGACLNVEECYPMEEWMLIRCKLCVFRCACEIVCLWAHGSVWRTLVADAARATGHSVYLPTGGKGGAPLITAKQTDTRMSPSSEHTITVFFPVDIVPVLVLRY